ncbi:MAG: M28 family peptidase [Candidatus Kapaibacteriales bacterium]
MKFIRKSNIIALTLLVFIFPSFIIARNEDWEKVFSFSYFKNRGYEVLKKICDEAGGRLSGTLSNEKAIDILIDEAKKDGLIIRKESFEMPAWTRQSDTVEVIEPFRAIFRAVGLGFNNPLTTGPTEVVFVQNGYSEDYDSIDANDKIALVLQARPKNKEELLRYEAIEIAWKKGARAILFLNDKHGGLVLAGVGNFQGNPNPIPAFSITKEDGERLIRLIQSGVKPKIRIVSYSYCRKITSHNLVYTIPGKSERKIVVGGHFDSWDISQGAIDNGVGLAVLYEVARNLSRFAGKIARSIEIVWFNGEELGLWGSKRYVETHKDEVDCMINLDMIGTPRGFNAMGFKDLIPFLQVIVDSLNGFDLNQGVVNMPWTNSDHMYFMFEGIPAITLTGYMDEEMYHHYHDFGDSFEKVNKRYLSDAGSIVSILTFELANYPLNFLRLSKNEVKDLLNNFNLQNRLKKQKEWRFD